MHSRGVDVLHSPGIDSTALRLGGPGCVFLSTGAIYPHGSYIPQIALGWTEYKFPSRSILGK